MLLQLSACQHVKSILRQSTQDEITNLSLKSVKTESHADKLPRRHLKFYSPLSMNYATNFSSHCVNIALLLLLIARQSRKIHFPSFRLGDDRSAGDNERRWSRDWKLSADCSFTISCDWCKQPTGIRLSSARLCRACACVCAEFIDALLIKDSYFQFECLWSWLKEFK